MHAFSKTGYEHGIRDPVHVRQGFFKPVLEHSIGVTDTDEPAITCDHQFFREHRIDHRDNLSLWYRRDPDHVRQLFE